ncbi:MAG: GNAT family N-acetyltransferase [Candidatus Dormibacteraceae bacterium]
MSLGYRLRRAFWRRGYATEGARALIHRGFTELGVQRVFATTYQDNLASRRVMEKLAMRLVRRYRITTVELLGETDHLVSRDGLWDGDDLEYALLKDEWEGQASRQR